MAATDRLAGYMTYFSFTASRYSSTLRDRDTPPTPPGGGVA
jgi:hypothetical protein